MAEADRVDDERSRGAPSAIAWLTPLLLAAAAVVAAVRVAAGPHPYDAGELLAATWQLGGSHPPGQPLHALLAHVFTRVPLGPMAARVALFSSACALVAAALAARFTRELALELGATRNAAELGALAMVPALLLASPVLRQALRIEVYALALALTLFALLQLLAWARGDGARRLWLAAFLAGVTFAVHPPHAFAIALSALGFALASPERLRHRPARVGALALLSGALGLCANLYLPLRASAHAAMWGDPLSLVGFIDYVSGAAYSQKNLGAAQPAFAARLFEYARYLFAHGAGLALVAVAAAWLLRASARNTLLRGALLASGLAVLAACIHPLEVRNPDNVAYLAPSLCLALACANAALAALLATRARAIAGAGLLLIALQPGALAEARETARADLPALETFGGSLLDTPAPRALVVATTDFTAATWMLSQAVDGARPDAAVFVAGLATSSWQWRLLTRHRGLDGRPVLARGRDPHQQYLRGAIAMALGRVPVALERNAGLAFSGLTGAYLLLDPRAAQPKDANGSIGERLDHVIARDAERSAPGDHGAAHAIVRDYQQHRALRLAALGHGAEALDELRASLWSLPASERALLRSDAVQVSAQAIRLAPLVKDPDAYLASLEDCVRAAAAVLWSLGRDDAARTLLHAQLARGDARALLQLAWLELTRGDFTSARSDLAAGLRRAPQLREETAELELRLRH